MKGIINLESIWRRSLKAMGLYYTWLFHKERNYPSAAMKASRQFYASFIQEGDLVFDIGANMGRRVGSFLLLKAKVVALEPNQTCVAEIEKVYKGWPVTVIPKGVGAEPGELTFFISSNPLMSSFNKEWIAGMQQKFKDKWDKPVQVPVITLQQLIEEYGKPSFIKIDTEGFELEVLKGLQTAVPYLSFEYTIPEPAGKTIACVERIEELYGGKVLFNICRDEAWQMHFDSWMPAAELLALMRSADFTASSFGNYGDIYVKAL